MKVKEEIKLRLDKIVSYFASDESTDEATVIADDTTEVQTEFAEVTLLDGETVLSYEGDLVEGTAVFVMLDEESVPAPEGTHELGGDMEGVSITLDADGIILEVVDSREESEESEEVADEAMSTENVEAIVDEKMSEIDGQLNGILSGVEGLIEKNKALEAELSKFKTEFATFKNAPSIEEEKNKFSTQGEKLSRRQKYLNGLIKK